jgi:hypothetical protein
MLRLWRTVEMLQAYYAIGELPGGLKWLEV